MARLTTANRALGPRAAGSALTTGTTGTERHVLGSLARAPLSSANHAWDGVPEDNRCYPLSLGGINAQVPSPGPLWGSPVYPDVGGPVASLQ